MIRKGSQSSMRPCSAGRSSPLRTTGSPSSAVQVVSWTSNWRSITSHRPGLTIQYPNSFISTCMLTIWPRQRRTRSPWVPDARRTVIIHPTSSSSSIRAVIRSVSAHDARTMTGSRFADCRSSRRGRRWSQACPRARKEANLAAGRQSAVDTVPSTPTYSPLQ
jgi:hypothetical protein